MASRFVRPAADGAAPLDIAENVQHARLGTLSKRAGFTRLGAVAGVSSPARYMFSTGEKLSIADGSRLWTWNPELDTWHDRGPAPPGGLRYGLSLAGSRSYDDADLAGNGSFTILAGNARWTRRDFAAGDTVFDVVRVTVSTADGVVVLPSTDMLETSSDVNRRTNIRCAAASESKLLMCCTRGTGGSGGGRDLEFYEWNSSAPDQLPTLAWVQPNTLDDIRAYDVIGTDTGYLVAYIEGVTGNVLLRDMTADHVQTYVGTINTPSAAEAVSICVDSDGLSYVLVTLSGTPRDIVLYRRRADLSADYGPVSQIPLVATDDDGEQEDADYLGIATDGRTVISVCGLRNSGSSKARLSYVRSNASTGAKQPPVWSAQNCVPLSRPWVYAGRFYVAGATFQHRYPYDSGVVFELYADHNPLTDTIQPTVVALYHAGRADRGRNAGSAGNVITRGSSAQWLGFYYSEGFAHVDPTIDHYGDAHASSLVGAEVVELDYSAPISSANTAEGETVVGGSLVTYAGRGRSTELGFIVPPCIRNDSGLSPFTESEHPAAIPGLPPGEYSYTAIWRYIDDGGVMHRSVPAPPQFITITPPSATNFRFLYLYAKANGASNRLVLDDASVAFYRANTGGIYRRVDAGFVENAAARYATSKAADTGLELADAEPLYTTGGVLENVAPDGANATAAVGGRLWLGGFRRVQFSKPLAPASVASRRLAPEFNEGFTLRLPGNDECTGIADLDGAPVLFTPKTISIASGNGPNSVGAGGSFQLQRITSDDGCKDLRSVVAGLEGVFFQGARGICLLTRALQVEFIGAAVVDQTEAFPVVTSAVLVSHLKQVRFTVTNVAKTDGRVLVYDYFAKTWLTWTLRQGPKINPSTVVPVSACVHRGVYHVLGVDARVWREDSGTHLDDGTLWVTTRVRTSWLAAAGANGWQRVWRVAVLGEMHSDAGLKVRLFHDWETEPDFEHSRTEGDLASYLSIGDRMQQQLLVKRQQCTSVSVEVEDTEPLATGNGRGIEFAGISLLIGIKPGLARLGSSQK